MFTEVSVVSAITKHQKYVRIAEASSEIFKRYIFVAIKRWDIIFWYSALNGASTIQGR